jgi:DNA-binding transcriptional ArsR family regulator
VTNSPFDARELVGLLADDDRRRVFAALVLGADTIAAVQADTGLDARAAGRSVQRLVDAGLVVRGDDGGLHLLGEAFTLAARAEAERAPRSPEHDDEPEDVARVLRVFVRDGRLTSIPTVHSKRLVVLDWLVQRFDPGRRYPEATVNLIIAAVHPDTAALRRYLVDEGLLDREHGEYWRAGGTFDPA